MNTTDEQVARELWDRISNPDVVTVRVPVLWNSAICIPCIEEKAEDVVVAKFGVFTFGDNHVLDMATSESVPALQGNSKITVRSPAAYRELMLKKKLLSWSIGIEIEREDGWMTESCYKRVGSISAPVIESLLDKYEIANHMTEDEERILVRQSAMLFTGTGRGVSDACEAVSSYCNMTAFWDKFGLDKQGMFEMPMREFTMLKNMMEQENTAGKQAKRQSQTGAMVAGAGGKMRPSRGKRISM